MTTETTNTETTEMEQETLFTASKWDILTELRNGPYSPVKLAELLNTSVANVSQQLRLLEMAGLVESKRISNREKGLPRVLYSLAGNHSYLIAAAKEFVDKKFVQLTERNKVTLRIWFLDRPDLHYFLEKAFWSIDALLKDIDALLLDKKMDEIELTLVSDKNLKIEDLEITNPDGKTHLVKFKLVSGEKAEKLDSGKYYILYDPRGLFNGKESDDNEK